MLCDICGKELEKVTECAWTSCPKLFDWDENRIDQIGQNGNEGLHYLYYYTVDYAVENCDFTLKGFRDEV